MVQIGNFFFKYRNNLFILLYALLWMPGPLLFTEECCGPNFWMYPLISGLVITVLGQLIRGITIGLAYIIRGGKDKKVYAEELVTTGIFNHCRNPLYVGNILMLFGVGIMSNSLLYTVLIMPFFLFIYQAIVLAEENFLRGKFGASFDAYCSKVNRWIPSLSGIGATLSSMEFKYKRWILKEYNTQFVWLLGIILLFYTKYPQVTGYTNDRWYTFGLWVLAAVVFYVTVRYLKKSGKVSEE